MFNFKLIFLFIFIISFSSGAVEVGITEGGVQGVSIILPEDIASSSSTVNGSNSWNTTSLGVLTDADTSHFSNVGGTLTILTSFITNLIATFSDATATVLFGEVNATIFYEDDVSLEDKYQLKVNPGEMLAGINSEGKYFRRIS